MSVLREVHRLLPPEDLVYIADSAHTPYGDRRGHSVAAVPGLVEPVEAADFDGPATRALVDRFLQPLSAPDDGFDRTDPVTVCDVTVADIWEGPSPVPLMRSTDWNKAIVSRTLRSLMP